MRKGYMRTNKKTEGNETVSVRERKRFAEMERHMEYSFLYSARFDQDFPSKAAEYRKLLKLGEYGYVMNIEIDSVEENSSIDIKKIPGYLPLNTMTNIPILGSVRAGYGGLANQEILGYEPTSVTDADAYFYLEVEGNSMSPMINEGDLVLVKKQTSVDSGDLAVVIVDDEEGVVKKVNYGKDYIELISINPYYPVRRFENEDVLSVSVVGKVVESKRKYY